MLRLLSVGFEAPIRRGLEPLQHWPQSV